MKKIDFLKYLWAVIIPFLLLPSISHALEINNLRNQRYCEIFLGNSKIRTINLDIYNTIGLNECPKELWDDLSIEQIKKESGATIVHFNGPRRWVIDGIQNAKIPNMEPKIFGAIAMREVAMMQVYARELLGRQEPYEPHSVKRETTWVYLAGKPVYELINPQGQVFVMQSFSLQNVDQTEESIETLNERLNLPNGWKFRTRILESNAYLTPANNMAVVIQDDFLNTYQMEVPLFNLLMF